VVVTSCLAESTVIWITVHVAYQLLLRYARFKVRPTNRAFRYELSRGPMKRHIHGSRLPYALVLASYVCASFHEVDCICWSLFDTYPSFVSLPTGCCSKSERNWRRDSVVGTSAEVRSIRVALQGPCTRCRAINRPKTTGLGLLFVKRGAMIVIKCGSNIAQTNVCSRLPLPQVQLIHWWRGSNMPAS